MKSKLLLFLFTLSIISCGGKAPGNNRIQVFTSILPQKFFVEKIAGDTVQINVLVGPGKSPATYEPTPDQVLTLSKSKIFFAVGVPFEKAFLGRIKDIKGLKIVDTSSGIKKRFLEHHEHHDNQGHNKNEEHDDHGTTEDPHTWMSPKLAEIHAKNIYEALSELIPDRKEQLKKNYDTLISDLEKLHEMLKKNMTPLKGKTIFVFHPAFGYFSDEYGMKQEAIETGGKSPLPSQLAKIIGSAKTEKVKVIFVQPEFSEKSAGAVAKAIGGAVIKLNPLNPDYINNLKMTGERIRESFTDGKKKQ